jgi:transposase
MFAVLGREYAELAPRIAQIDKKMLAFHRSNEVTRRLMEVPTIGPTGACLFITKIVDPHAFRSGRRCAAWIGLTPKDHSTAGKQKLGGITRAGDERLRAVLVSGAMACIRHAKNRPANSSPWLVELLKRKPPKLAAVALANKTARIIWKLMVSGERYNPQRAPQRFVPPTDSLAPGTRRQGQAACGGDLRSALTAPALRAPSAPPSA